MDDLVLQLLNADLLPAYRQAAAGLAPFFNALKDAEISTESFSFYTSVSAMASSKIEGEPLEIDSYIKHKMLNIKYLNDLVEKPNDLYKAYLFAQKNALTSKNFLKAHKTISAHLFPKKNQGVFRTSNMLIMKHKTFRIQYEAAPPGEVKNLMGLLWKDIETLKKQSLNVEEVFYFASFIHMVFVNIHPFEDGNGRAGRLLEKWFVAQMLGQKAWYIQSELHYYKNVDDYYKNLNRLGVFFEQLDYSKALPFLLMLARSLDGKGNAIGLNH